MGGNSSKYCNWMDRCPSNSFTTISSVCFFLPQGISLYTAQVFSVALAFIFITTLQIILGESVPKAIALQNTESTLLDVIPYLTIFVNIFNPFIWLLNVVCNFVLRSFGLSNFTKQELTHSEEEIKMILEHSSQKGIFKKHEIEMVYNIFKMGDSSVKDIMVPRTEIIGFNINTTLADIAKRIEKNLHSRFPVYRYSVDNIIGFIHIKDFYRSLLTSNQKTKLRETNLVRKIISIPENIKIDELLYLMRKQWIHIAVVHNEYSETCGIVSLEDVLEAVTGDIQDEFDDHIKEIQKESPGTYLIQSHTSLDRIRNKFKIKLENENFNTVGGLVLAKIRKKPKKGDKITVDSISLEVIEVRKRKIKTIRLKTRGITHHSIKAQTKSHAIIN